VLVHALVAPPRRHFAHHGIESFATWQRYFLRDFEAALQKTDRELDKSGHLLKAYGPLYLPYWVPAAARRLRTQTRPGLLGATGLCTHTECARHSTR